MTRPLDAAGLIRRAAPRQTRRTRTASGALAYAAFIAVAAIALPARAQMEVVDPANLAENIEQSVRAVEQIQNQLRQIEAMTSHEGYGALSDGAAERTLRRYAPRSWEDALAVLEAGGLPGDSADVARIVGDLRARYAPLTAEELSQAGVGAQAADEVARAQASGLLAEGLASHAFAQIETRIGQVEEMLGAIDASPDLKAAEDLQARITGEVALAQLELVRLQALSDALAAQDANRRNAAQARMARFLNGAPATTTTTTPSSR